MLSGPAVIGPKLDLVPMRKRPISFKSASFTDPAAMTILLLCNCDGLGRTSCSSTRCEYPLSSTARPYAPHSNPRDDSRGVGVRERGVGVGMIVGIAQNGHNLQHERISEVANCLSQFHVLGVEVLHVLRATSGISRGCRVAKHTATPCERRLQRTLENGRYRIVIIIWIDRALAILLIGAIGCLGALSRNGNVDVGAYDITCTAALHVSDCLLGAILRICNM
mmetsp:Transcript_30469/g.93117  ORF Transcript_30469/g.93117 Transcript_30469/m.93117 type:complete len:223 (-) Transcript_30469:548-1216(-)